MTEFTRVVRKARERGGLGNRQIATAAKQLEFRTLRPGAKPVVYDAEKINQELSRERLGKTRKMRLLSATHAALMEDYRQALRDGHPVPARALAQVEVAEWLAQEAVRIGLLKIVDQDRAEVIAEETVDELRNGGLLSVKALAPAKSVIARYARTQRLAPSSNRAPN